MKSEILRLLKSSDTYLSGQQICEQFQVSRTAVEGYGTTEKRGISD